MHSELYKRKYAIKRFGQNFLKDKYIIKKIISFINPKINDLLVEIGPGLGALTYPISYYVDHLYAIELDKKLFLYLKENINFNKKITIFNTDVMNFNFLDLKKNKNQKIRIFGNLPYNISTQIIFYLFKYHYYINDMYFMFQKEVADRLVAIPGSKNYGRLSVMSQYYYDIKKLLHVPSESFIPKPKVKSTFVKLLPRKKNLYKINIFILDIILKEAFSKRRKIISNSLKNIFSCNILDKLLISNTLRAENISKEQFYQLAYFYENKMKYDKVNL